MTRRDETTKAPAIKPAGEQPPAPGEDGSANAAPETTAPEPLTVSKEERAAIMEARNNGPVAYTTVTIADALIAKGLAAVASVDPAPGEGHKAISLTLTGKSWAARNGNDD